MKSIHTGLLKSSQWISWIGGFLILCIAIVVSIDVITRKFTSINIQNVPEISGYLFAVAISWGFPVAFLQRRHIRIDTVYGLLPRRFMSYLDFSSAVLVLIVVSILGYHVAEVFFTSWSAGSRSLSTLGARLWIPQLFWVGGFIFFVVTAAFIVIACLVSLARCDPAAVYDLAGLPSIREEIEEETRGETVGETPAPFKPRHVAGSGD